MSNWKNLSETEKLDRDTKELVEKDDPCTRKLIFIFQFVNTNSTK